MSGNIWLGTANWTDHKDFYPEGMRPADRLAHYARYLPMVELNASFYRIFSARQYAQWAARTPEGFGFLVKVYRAISWHLRDEPPVAEHFEAHLRAIEPLRAAGKFLGFLVQFPPWFRRSERNHAYLQRLRAGFPDDRLGVELRHRGWFEGDARAETLERLRGQRLSHVILDEPHPEATGLVPMIAELTDPGTAYYRFQGRDPNGQLPARQRHVARERHVYTPEEIGELADVISNLHTGQVESLVLFHNNFSNNAVLAARQMIDALSARGRPVHPPPDDAAPLMQRSLTDD